MTLVKRGKIIIDQDSTFENFDLLKKKYKYFKFAVWFFFSVVSVFEVSNLL